MSTRNALHKADEYVTNALIGAGYGIQNQLEGLYQIATHPVKFGRDMAGLARNALADPRAFGGAIRNALSGTASRAASGPLGFGEVVGENLPLNPSAYMRRVPAMRDITVYHGSPHDFAPEPGHPLGRPRMDKIGTGEGAQAYGHGIYVAESPGVAKTYQQQGGLDAAVFLKSGRRLVGKELDDDLLQATKYLDQGVKDAGKFKHNVKYYARKAAQSQNAPDGVVAAIEKYGDDYLRSDYVPTSGRLYHVDLADEHIATMLDWDAPLSEQPEAIHEIVRDMLKQQGYLRPNDNGPRQLQTAFKAWKIERAGMAESGKGESIYGLLSKQLGSDEAASNYLRERGIPGIKYWDAGSREAGRGTRNYVVFDDKLLKILSKE